MKKLSGVALVFLSLPVVAVDFSTVIFNEKAKPIKLCIRAVRDAARTELGEFGLR